MLDPKQLDEFAKRFSENLPSGLRDFQQEVEKNTRSALQSAFSRMDLVTREEFDAQSKVLARTREKLDALEGRLAALEQASAGGATSSKAGTAGPAGSRSTASKGGASKAGASKGRGSGKSGGGGSGSTGDANR